MTDSTAKSTGNSGQANLVPFKKGFDPRRWMKGRPKKPANMKAAEELVQHVIWEILSEEITNPATGEQVDRLRAMIRSMTTNKNMQDKILDRILGKVSQPVEVGGEGKIELIVKYADTNNKPTESTS